MDVASPDFWGALGSIVLANVVLSGDNAVMIALASGGLPQPLQRRAVIWGSAAAIALRIVLTVAAVQLMSWPYVKAVAGLLLLWIGVSLLAQHRAGDSPTAATPSLTLGAAIRTILLADLLMSLDNVLAVVAAAAGNLTLLVLGLALSIPLIVFGSSLMLALMRRWPVIIALGAALLGFLAAQMLLSDPAAVAHWGPVSANAARGAGVAGAVLVLVLGRYRHRQDRH